MQPSDVAFGFFMENVFKTRRVTTKHTTRMQVIDAMIVVPDASPTKKFFRQYKVWEFIGYYMINE